MKKHNVRESVTEQTKLLAKRARRARRKAKRVELVQKKLKPLLVKLGALQAQINQLEKEKQLASYQSGSEQSGSVADTASGAGQGS